MLPTIQGLPEPVECTLFQELRVLERSTGSVVLHRVILFSVRADFVATHPRTDLLFAVVGYLPGLFLTHLLVQHLDDRLFRVS